MPFVLKKTAERRLWTQHPGTGWLILKTADETLLQVEVLLRPDGMLCRIKDGKPTLADITIEEAAD